MIKGIDIILYEKTQTGVDSLNKAVYEEKPVVVKNVLVSPTTEQEELDTLNLTGRKAIYTMAIPKGDTHIWEDVNVEFFGEKWHTIGMPIKGIEALIPLEWNTKVRVERYG